MQNLPLQTQMVYGPVGSRRIGLSLGINLSPYTEKLCSFNCVYCHYGWTKRLTSDPVSKQVLLPEVADLKRQLEEYEVERYLLDHVTFSGNGESSQHPDFGKAVDIAIDFRDRCVPQAKTAILSNSSTVCKEEVRQALLKLDRRIMKLDAGDELTFKKINRPPPEIKFEDIVNGLKELGDFEIQTTFVDGSVSNCDQKAVDEWLATMTDLNPQAVQIYTLDRAPADSQLVAVERQRMRDIFLAAKKAGLSVTLH
jgi:wyosine [tRNA(Phe)-imidazoG37] synthetase (radical SAM superfamily)